MPTLVPFDPGLPDPNAVGQDDDGYRAELARRLHDLFTNIGKRVLGIEQALGINGSNDLANTGPGFKNALSDGGFEVWDGSRTLTLAAATGYSGCTMWSYQSGAGFAGYSISRQAGLTTGSQYCLRYQRTAAGANTVSQILIYDMETVDSLAFAGQTVTFSFTARAGANFSGAGTILQSIIATGTGTDQAYRTAPYTGAILTAQNNPITTTAQRFQMTLAVPANATQIGVGFAFTPVGTAGAADYFELDDVQIELGTIATNFERLPFGVQQKRTERYYWKTFPYNTAPAQNAGTTGTMADVVAVAGAIASGFQWSPFPSRMRIAPTLTGYNPSAANALARNTSLGTDSTVNTLSSSEWGWAASFTQPFGTSVGNVMALHVQADARL
jgi:hypothetical protein